MAALLLPFLAESSESLCVRLVPSYVMLSLLMDGVLVLS
uniref:Uncharacterized protein n=1 Tax=Arundo donax TaxID=35708 RepID=A0A0A9AJV6_ARUDO